MRRSKKRTFRLKQHLIKSDPHSARCESAVYSCAALWIWIWFMMRVLAYKWKCWCFQIILYHGTWWSVTTIFIYCNTMQGCIKSIKKTFIMPIYNYNKKISVSNKCCSFELSSHQIIMKKLPWFPQKWSRTTVFYIGT